MTLSTSGYTVGSNQPLNHARILWDMIEGTVTADGSDGDLAANDYTFQRWAPGAGSQSWTIQTAADADVDCVFIAAHNLSGLTVTIATSATTGGAFTTRATINPTDNTTIAALFNNSGTAYTVRRVRVTVSDGDGVRVGIIRAGVALQMTQPIYGGHGPLGLNRVTEAQQQISETGQWLGRMEKRRALSTTYEWEHLEAAWYRSTFEPFARTLPLKPFGIVGNPSKMTDDVGWCWTDQDVRPANMGIADFMDVSLPVTGFW